MGYKTFLLVGICLAFIIMISSHEVVAIEDSSVNIDVRKLARFPKIPIKRIFPPLRHLPKPKVCDVCSCKQHYKICKYCSKCHQN